MYRYLSVRRDAAYAGDAAVPELIACLATFAALVQTGERTFAGADGTPWLRVLVVRADAAGNYADDGEPLARANLIELICADGSNASRPHYDALARALADALGWAEVVDANGATVPAWTLRFGEPAHGWLEVVLAGPDGTSRLDVSDVPGDSLAMLVDAARDVVEGLVARDVTWFLEPICVTWQFRTRGDQIEVVAHSDDPRDRGSSTTIGAATAADLGGLIARALHRLASAPAWSARDDRDGGRIWSHAFPTAGLAALDDRLSRRHAR